MKENRFPDNLVDVNGNSIKEDDVVFDGENYFRIYWNDRHPQVEAFSPTYGYIHIITQETASSFKRIGTYEECEHLMIVD